MSKISIQYRFIAIVAALMVLVCIVSILRVQPVEAVSCTVPSAMYATIQSALDDPSCDAVDVGSGTFYEQLSINRPVTLIGAGSTATVIDGIAGGSVLTIKTTDVTLQDLAITNGSAQSGGGIYNDGSDLDVIDCQIETNFASGSGGGLFSKQGSLAIQGSTFTMNEADTGGGIYIESGAATIANCSIEKNESGFHAGGLFAGYESETTLIGVTIKENVCDVDGGGIFNNGTMTIYESSIHGNQSKRYSGGGIRNEGKLFVNNSTISGNECALGGGGIDSVNGTLRLNSSTVSFNHGGDGGGVTAADSDVRVANSILAGNGGWDCRDTIRSNGYNIIQSTEYCDFRATAGDLIHITPNLGALQGNPAYHPLRFGPGINAGNPDGCMDHKGQLLDTDQPGQLRQGICDMGAFEYQGEYHQAFLPQVMSYICLDFVDDFSNPRSGWSVGEDDYVQFGYNQGEYQIRSKNDDYLYLFASPSCEREDFVIEADARWADDPGMAYGIIFSIKGDFDQYYLFAINSEYQVFWLDYRAPDGWTALVEPTQTGIINRNQGTNHLRVERSGDQISLSISGLLVRQLRDSHISGLVGSGLFAAPYDGIPNSDARFDNFSSRNLTQNGMTAPALHASLSQMMEGIGWLNDLEIRKAESFRPNS